MGEPVVDPVTGDVIDPETGEVIGRVMVHGYDASIKVVAEPQRRHFHWVAPSMHDFGLHTYVEDDRLSRLNERVRASGRARLVRELRLLWDACARLFGEAKTALIDDAATIIRRAEAVLPPSSVRPPCLVGAAIVLAARRLGIPVTDDEVARVLGVPRRCVRLALRRLWDLGYRLEPVPIQSYVWRFASVLGAEDAAGLAIEIASRVGCVRSPRSVAAAALYIALAVRGRRVATRDMARAIGMSDRSISIAAREILSRIDIEVVLDEDRGGGGEG